MLSEKATSDLRPAISPTEAPAELAVSDAKKPERQIDGKILTLPNAISILGLSMVMKGCVGIDTAEGLSLVVGGRLMDLLDGYVARHLRGQESNLGKIIDASSDKIANIAIMLSLWGHEMAPRPVLGAFLAQNAFNAIVTSATLIKKPTESYKTPYTGKYSMACSMVSMGSFATAEMLNRADTMHPAALALGAVAWTAAVGWGVLAIPASKEYYSRLTSNTEQSSESTV